MQQKFALFLLFSAIFGCALSFNNQYVVKSISQQPNLVSAIVDYTGTDNYYIKPNSTIIKTLNFTFVFEGDNEARLIIDDLNGSRFKIPHKAPFSHKKTENSVTNPEYNVSITESPFSFRVYRVSTGETIFDSAGYDFIFSALYMTVSTTLPTRYLYGLGERAGSLLYQNGTYTIWNKDQFCMIDDRMGGTQTYGTHPMYLNKEQSGNWDVVFLRNINAMDLVFNPDTRMLQYILTGGVMEFKFFLGDKNPETSIRAYHQFIGEYMIQPFWAHGYHQSRWGMIYLSDMTEIVDKMAENRLQLDVIWSDIDYMYDFTDFTIDELRYNVQQFKALAQRIKWVPIVDAGVSMNYSAASYQVGTEMDVWIKSVNNNSNPLIGVVWPGIVHWPDFFHPNATPYWQQMFQMMHDQVPFAGIWLDMNELSNFCYGEWPNDCTYLKNYLPDAPNNTDSETEFFKFDKNHRETISKRKNKGKEALHKKVEAEKEVFQVNTSEIYSDFEVYDYLPFINSSIDLPYLPGHLPLENKTLSTDVLHYGDLQEYDVHNLNGFMEGIVTQAALRKILLTPRPFLLSRSTYAGSGAFTTHWTGDNAAEWIFLQLSIPQIMSFNMFGIPMTGSDICGFVGNTTVELCSRWMQLGALYPFMRNHMTIGTIEHTPYAMGPVVLAASRASLNLRYSILKFYYSIFVRNKGAGTVFKPLFFDFPDDENLLGLETQFLIGSELMGAPAVYEGLTTVGVYFPGGARWFDFLTGALVSDSPSGQNITVDAPLSGTPPLFIKSGSIVHKQNVDNVLNTYDLDTTFDFVVALNPTDSTHGQANGQMMSIGNYNSDINLAICAINCLIDVSITTEAKGDNSVDVTLTFTPNSSLTVIQDIYVNTVTLYGVERNGQETITLEYDSADSSDEVASYTFPQGTRIQGKSYTFTV